MNMPYNMISRTTEGKVKKSLVFVCLPLHLVFIVQFLLYLFSISFVTCNKYCSVRLDRIFGPIFVKKLLRKKKLSW